MCGGLGGKGMGVLTSIQASFPLLMPCDPEQGP